jgi:hypothetical protein
VPTPLEAEINALLFEHQGDAVIVADALVMRMSRNILNENEVIDCFQFLLVSGLTAVFFHQINRLIDRQGRLPWAQLTEALGKASRDKLVKLNKLDIQALFEAAESQQATADLVRSHLLDKLDPGFEIRRRAFEKVHLGKIDEQKQALKDKLAYMQANRMFEQEAQVLDEMQAMFPNENEINAEREAHKLRWAREIIANSSASTDKTLDLNWRVDQLPPEQLKAKMLLMARARELAENDPRLAYDLAISLHMMDFSSEALDILQNAEITPAAEWLRLELMIRSRQFLTALEAAGRLEIDYANDPNTAFAVTYARARALHGLGQVQEAIELLQSLVNIRPHYRSAQSLLLEWAGGDA